MLVTVHPQNKDILKRVIYTVYSLIMFWIKLHPLNPTVV